MSRESRADALARLQPWVDRARDFSGWDFSDLRVRDLEPGPPWDYAGVIAEHASSAAVVADLGTGGGERLASFRDVLPARVVATEAWHVNAPIARARLRPLGVEVVRAWSEDGALPFADASFDLVIDRHEALDPSEVARVLSAAGMLVTQQVYRHDREELRPHFPRMTDFGDHLADYRREFEALGFEVASIEDDHRVAYPSLGEVVYLICVTPWEIEDFDLEADLDALLALEASCLTEDGLVLTACRYLLTARKPG